MPLDVAMIPLLSEWIPRVGFVPLRTETRPAWTCFNPSLVRRADGRLMAAVRSSNYRMNASGNYDIDDPDGVVRTESRLVVLDKQLLPSPGVLVVEPDESSPVGSAIRGYEDLRLFESDGGLGALACVRDRDATGICRMVLLDIAEDGRVTREVVLDGPDSSRHEKNWVPIAADGDRLLIVYQWNPVVRGHIDLGTGVLTLDAPNGRPHARADGWPGARGGGGGAVIGDDGEQLFVVHEAIVMPDWSRRYLHRFVTISAEGRAVRESVRLAFLSRGVEFAAGLALDRQNVLVSFGREDEEAWIASFPLAELLEKLTTVDAGGLS